MADYYELLGVDADAPVDDIRAAYRDKKAAVADTGTDAAKADAAALNKAWNVLSDPYQRGRYDQQLASGDDVDDEYEDDDDDGDAAPVKRSAKSNTSAKANARRNARPPLQPTIALPAGMRFPATRQRIIAMSIDLGVLVVLFIASQFLMVSVEKSQHPDAYRQVATVLPDKIKDAHDVTSAAKKTASAAEKKLEELQATKSASTAATQEAQAARDKADRSKTDAEKAEDALDNELTKQQKVLAPTSRLFSGLFFLVAFVLLLGSSLVLQGQTIGKRIQKLRVVRLDGTPARATELFRRYTLLVFAAYAAFSVLGPVGALIVVFVATIWTRNANQQGLQDRFAKTLVVTDE